MASILEMVAVAPVRNRKSAYLIDPQVELKLRRKWGRSKNINRRGHGWDTFEWPHRRELA